MFPPPFTFSHLDTPCNANKRDLYYVIKTLKGILKN